MGRRKKKILLIDESVAGLLVGKMILGGAAYDVITARTRPEGIAKALSERPDLIVLSTGDPPPAGCQHAGVCEDLRANDGIRATPILLVTTRMRGPSATHAGCDSLTKPISGLELLTKVRSGLRERQDSGGEA